MAHIYNFSRNALLERIGLTPGKKPLMFFIGAGLLTLPFGYVYNSVALILFVVYSLLAFKKENAAFYPALILPAALYLIMVLSVSWSADVRESVKALSREAPLLFLPLIFSVNMPLSRKSTSKILDSYSLGMVLFCVFLLFRALLRYSELGNTEVFFYHELATNDINAIYLSALVAPALFHFISIKIKTVWSWVSLIFLLIFLILLSSKIVIGTTLVIITGYILFWGKMAKSKRLAILAAILALIATVGYFGKINERIQEEFSGTRAESTGSYSVTLKEAWTKDSFGTGAYFNGSAFRLYQIRIFTEMLQEEPILFTGYGLNASVHKVGEKAIEHDLYRDSNSPLSYHTLNFHNQYVETFADLGVFGFLAVVLMLLVNLKNAFKNKHFVHIAFAFLMISLFLTESFLWRQRGVVFFTMLYCLFNTGLMSNRLSKHKE